MFVNLVLKGMLASQMNELMGGCSNLLDEGLRNFISFPSIVRIVQSRGREWHEWKKRDINLEV